MRTLLIVLFLFASSITANAKPHCQGFNNYDNKVTIVFTDDNAGKRYSVSDVKLIPSLKGKEYKATSVETVLKKRRSDCYTCISSHHTIL